MSETQMDSDAERKGNRLSKIVTRTGDAGTTGLGDGSRTTKDSLRIDAMGEVDELNSGLGVLLCEDLPHSVQVALLDIQNDLFDLGADLAVPDTGKPLGYEPLRVVAAQVARVEHDIDALNAKLQPLRSFVLPGGSPASAALHIARTVARRAERLMVELAQKPGEHVNPEGLKYINRVSDFLFVAARAVNDNGNADVLWVPGKNR